MRSVYSASVVGIIQKDLVRQEVLGQGEMSFSFIYERETVCHHYGLAEYKSISEETGGKVVNKLRTEYKVFKRAALRTFNTIAENLSERRWLTLYSRYM